MRDRQESNPSAANHYPRCLGSRLCFALSSCSQVNRHAYDGVELLAGKQSIISKGEVPEAEGRQIPLEIKVAGEFEPEYRTPVDVQVRS